MENGSGGEIQPRGHGGGNQVDGERQGAADGCLPFLRKILNLHNRNQPAGESCDKDCRDNIRHVHFEKQHEYDSARGEQNGPKKLGAENIRRIERQSRQPQVFGNLFTLASKELFHARTEGVLQNLDLIVKFPEGERQTRIGITASALILPGKIEFQSDHKQKRGKKAQQPRQQHIYLFIHDFGLLSCFIFRP